MADSLISLASEATADVDVGRGGRYRRKEDLDRSDLDSSSLVSSAITSLACSSNRGADSHKIVLESTTPL